MEAVIAIGDEALKCMGKLLRIIVDYPKMALLRHKKYDRAFKQGLEPFQKKKKIWKIAGAEFLVAAPNDIQKLKESF